VLGADVVVVEKPCFLLGENDDPAGTVRETFEQKSASLAERDVKPVYRRPTPTAPVIVLGSSSTRSPRV
jgi:hypothetical protein